MSEAPVKDLRDYSDAVWDAFFDFLSEDVDDLTDDEISAELKEAGIDVSDAVARVKQHLTVP